MIKHTFTNLELFYAQYYRYRALLSALIITFGIFAIGVMIISGAPLIIGLMLFLAYLILAYIVMLFLLVFVGMFHYYGAYKNVSYTYQLTDDLLIVGKDGQEIVRMEYDTLETKVYKKMTYIYDKQIAVAFFPENVRKQLLK